MNRRFDLVDDEMGLRIRHLGSDGLPLSVFSLDRPANLGHFLMNAPVDAANGVMRLIRESLKAFLANEPSRGKKKKT